MSMTLRTLALLVSAILCLSQVIWRVQANAPRDWPEHALALACRMTYAKGGDVTCRTNVVTAATATRRDTAVFTVRSNAAPTFEPKAAAMTFNDSGGVIAATRVQRARPSKDADGANQYEKSTPDRQTMRRAAVTYFLRKLGLPRMRATVELRD